MSTPAPRVAGLQPAGLQGLGRFAPLLLLAFLASFVSSCSLKPKIDPKWQVAEIATPSDRMLWKLANMSVNGAGFPRGNLDLAEMEIESGWRNDLQPFKGRGKRTRAHVRMEPIERGLWNVEVRVEKEINDNLDRPLSLPDADWSPTGDDSIAAQIILQHITSLFSRDIELHEPIDPLDELLKRAGVPSDAPAIEPGSRQDS